MEVHCEAATTVTEQKWSAESFLRIDRAIDDVKLLSWIKSENYALFPYQQYFFFFFALVSSYRRFYLNRVYLFCFYSRGNFQSNSAMILSIQIISIFCITLNNNADGIFLSWIYFVRFYSAEHTDTHTHTHTHTHTAPVLYSHSEKMPQFHYI